MLYPIYVHKETDSAYGAIFPDLPGCHAAADDAQSLPVAAQEAVEAHFGADEEPIPAPSTPDAWAHDPDYAGGWWMMVDIDLSRVRSRAVRLNISLPENLVRRIDAAARQRGQSRSAFLARAAEHEMSEA
jgi:predicted RNase H-like HicB family nuclease